MPEFEVGTEVWFNLDPLRRKESRRRGTVVAPPQKVYVKYDGVDHIEEFNPEALEVACLHVPQRISEKVKGFQAPPIVVIDNNFCPECGETLVKKSE